MQVVKLGSSSSKRSVLLFVTREAEGAPCYVVIFEVASGTVKTILLARAALVAYGVPTSAETDAASSATDAWNRAQNPASRERIPVRQIPARACERGGGSDETRARNDDENLDGTRAGVPERRAHTFFFCERPASARHRRH